MSDLYDRLIAVQSELKAPKGHEGGVYAIVNPIGQIYIGSTSSFKRRFYQYKGLYEKKQKKLHESFLKYGIDNHQFFILEYCDVSCNRTRERFWGEFFNSIDDTHGLNDVIPFGLCSTNVRRKIGLKNKGKKLSQKHIESLVNSIKGKKQSAEHIEKRKMFGKDNPAFGNAHFKGHRHSLESKINMSRVRKGKGLLGDNPNSKNVIDIETGIVYSSAKEISILLKINYSTLKAWLQGRNNNERFKYL